MDGWNSAPRPKVDNRVGDMSKIGMVRTSSAGGLGPQMSSFNSMRSLSRKGNAGGNALTREGSGQSSRTATPGVATPPSVTSANSFEYVAYFDIANFSIFRNEGEAKDDENMPAPARPVKTVVLPDDDEIADGGYYTIPAMKTVASTASVANFVVVRKAFGSISYKDVVDLTGISSLSILREIVEIHRGRVTVYPNESIKPPTGQGLNVPAEVTLDKCFPPTDVDVDEHIDSLKSKPNTTFISYDTETGTWVFQVEHFSSYRMGRTEEST
jgi:hypothetical protein